MVQTEKVPDEALVDFEDNDVVEIGCAVLAHEELGCLSLHEQDELDQSLRVGLGSELVCFVQTAQSQ